jgi:hypothetical protein
MAHLRLHTLRTCCAKYSTSSIYPLRILAVFLTLPVVRYLVVSQTASSNVVGPVDNHEPLD